MFALNFDDSVFSLKDFKYDGEKSYNYRSYQIQKHSTVNIDKLVALIYSRVNSQIQAVYITFQFSDNNDN